MAAARLELDLARRSEDTSTRRLHLQRAHETLDRMQRLVTPLLMLARVDQLTELDDASPMQLTIVAETALREVSERAATRSIELSLDHEGDDRAQGGRGLLEILLQNLLDNTLCHSPQHGQVNVCVASHGDWATLEFNDSGSGFASADMVKLGGRFHRPEGSIGESGGLGLSIAQAIVRLHYGQLEFDRSHLRGARVSFSLPHAIPDVQQAGDPGAPLKT